MRLEDVLHVYGGSGDQMVRDPTACAPYYNLRNALQVLSFDERGFLQRIDINGLSGDMAGGASSRINPLYGIEAGLTTEDVENLLGPHLEQACHMTVAWDVSGTHAFSDASGCRGFHPRLGFQTSVTGCGLF